MVRLPLAGLRHIDFPWLDGRQALPALLAATLQDGAAIRGGHTFAESALAGTFQFRWLVCTFHCSKIP